LPAAAEIGRLLSAMSEEIWCIIEQQLSDFDAFIAAIAERYFKN
jgi:hypothetical protein